ncbi:hypothetical protein [Marinilabilia rubra]|uniref:DUF2225 domain-containing protein n=1 Tax=Marinilabilia rubra TaxID=2162893 RepID=A0A2U2B362_9BACT|nr:hypothetical protein [Marinilabilia rubra]PWD97503.1 hypothetical protein DDZ16_20405 [Marinilabilia rubra]
MNHSSPKPSPLQGLLIEKKIKCPACLDIFRTNFFLPKNLKARLFYSDGQTDISPITHPTTITNCAFCGFIFSIEPATHGTNQTKTTPPETFLSAPANPVGKPTKIKDYLLFLRRGVAANLKEEFVARKHLWWWLNNKREESSPLDHCLEDIWYQNMEKMLRIMDCEAIDKPAMKAELLRNIRMYDQCLNTLNKHEDKIPDNFKNQLKEQCSQKNPFRVKLQTDGFGEDNKHQEEGHKWTNPFIEVSIYKNEDMED